MGARVVVGPLSQVLQLDSSIAGRLQNVDYGEKMNLVMDAPAGPTNLRIGKSREIHVPEPFFDCGAGMSSTFYKWLQQTWEKNHARYLVSIIRFNDARRFVDKCEVSDTLIGEMILPSLDSAAKKVPAAISIRAVGERAELSSGNVSELPSRMYKMGVHAIGGVKQWWTSDYRLNIQGLEQASGKVTRVAPIRMSTGYKKVYVSHERFPNVEPTKFSVSDLVFEVPQNGAGDFLTFAERASGTGNRTSDGHTSGFLEYLAPDKKPYFRVDFHDLYFKQVTQLKGKGNGLVKIEFATDATRFSFDGRACVG